MAATATFLTSSITRLDLFCTESRIGIATGFFLRFESRWYLVTNWHVLAGREPDTGQPKLKDGRIPDHCTYYMAGIDNGVLQWFPVATELIDSTTQSARWYQHPTAGQDIDIGVLPINSNRIGLAKDFLALDGNDPNMFVDLGQDLYLPGFPLGLSAGGFLPIWKRASLASSLEFGHGINRFFFVDTATREGMSGAPCLAISNGRHYSLDRSTGKMNIVDRPISWRLLGVYSGRRNASDSFEAQIGIVWRENLILETIEAAVPATFELRSK
jgi:hypothetical protein